MIRLALKNDLSQSHGSYAPAGAVSAMRNSAAAPTTYGEAAPVQQQADKTVVQSMLQISIKDWDLLFEAVQSRLVRAVTCDAAEFNSASYARNAAAAASRQQVLDVVDDLEKLHRALNQERSKNGLDQRQDTR